MEKIEQTLKLNKYYYKNYELPNNIVFSRDLTGDKKVFNFIFEPAENIGIGIGLSFVYIMGGTTFASNLDESFDGTVYRDAFGDTYKKDAYNRFNELYAVDGAPAVVTTVYGNADLGIKRSLTDGNVTRCFNEDGLLVLIIALNRYNLFIERNSNNRIKAVYDRYNDKNFNKYSFNYNSFSQISGINKISADEEEFKSLVSANFAGILVSGFESPYGCVAMAYLNAVLSELNSDAGYKITVSSDKLEVKSTLSQVPDSTPVSWAPTISSWTFARSGNVTKITDADGNREIYKFNDDKLIIGHYIETVGKITEAKQFDYNENKLLKIVSKARDIFLNKSNYENYAFTSGEYSVYDYYADGTVKSISTHSVESDYISKYVKEYTYFNYFVDREFTSIYYRNDSEPTYKYHKNYKYDENYVLCEKEEFEMSSVEESESQKEEYKYDSNGNLIKKISYNSYDYNKRFIIEFAYDEYGRLISVTDESGEKTKFTYASGSRRPNEKTVLPDMSVKYSYDTADRLTEIYSGALKNTVTYCNNELTQLSDTSTDANKLNFVYDSERRLKKVIQGPNILQSYLYENGSADKTITKTNALNETFKIVAQKDGNGWKSYYNNNLEFESDFKSYEDDEDGYIWHELTTKDKLTSQNEYYYYSAYGTLDNYRVSTPSNFMHYYEKYNHELNGDLVSISISGIVDVYYKFKYTATRQLESVQYGDVKIKYSYDRQQRYIGNEVNNGERLIQKEEVYYYAISTSTITKVTHIPHSVSFTNGADNSTMSMWYDFDIFYKRITGISYDGNIIKYAYDNYNRLIRENNKLLDKTCIYDYDEQGNIKSVTTYPYTLADSPSGGTTVQYAYSGNKLTSYNGETCVYDALGNPTKYRNKTATWKGRQMQSFNGITFKYDGKGRRTGKGNTTYYYDSQDRLIKSSNGLEFYYGMTGLASFKYNGSMYFYRKDLQGNIIAILDSLGKVVVKYDYDAWGNHTITASNETIANLNPFRYRGYFYDTDTGLYYLKTRYYDPEVGRFLNMDAVDYADPKTLGGLNLYSYCNNNPVMYVDPDGHSVILTCLIIGAIIGAVGGGLIAYSEASSRGITGAELAGWIFIGVVAGGVIGGAVGAGLGLLAGTAIGGAGASMAFASGEAVAISGVKVLGGIATLGYVFSKWVPGSWPGDDPTVPPGDDFVWRGPGDIGSKYGEWFNKNTGDQLHPDLNHSLPKGPHWGWRNKLLKILQDIFK